MAIAIVQKDSNINASGSVAVTLTGVGAGSALIALAYSFNDAVWDVSSNVDGAFTEDLSFQPAFYCSKALSKFNVSSGTHILTLANGNVNSQLHVWEISGLANSGAFDQSATGTPSGSSASIGPTGTTAQADEIVFGFFHAAGAGNYSAGSGYTLKDQNDATFTRDGASEAKIVSATGTYSADFTCGFNVAHEGIVVTYKQAGAGGGGGAFPHHYYYMGGRTA